jgi:quinol-cytochrome oxidoreductase complex cytochrome b subunit
MLIYDLILMGAFGYSGQLGGLSWIAAQWIPNFILQFGIYPFFPWLESPIIPFWMWGHTNEIGDQVVEDVNGEPTLVD